jgi:hypothetical protein
VQTERLTAQGLLDYYCNSEETWLWSVDCTVVIRGEMLEVERLRIAGVASKVAKAAR